MGLKVRKVNRGPIHPTTKLVPLREKRVPDDHHSKSCLDLYTALAGKRVARIPLLMLFCNGQLSTLSEQSKEDRLRLIEKVIHAGALDHRCPRNDCFMNQGSAQPVLIQK